MPSILVINPNSSTKVTDGLRAILNAPAGITLEFYTAPASSPREIDGAQSLVLSEQATLPDLVKKNLHTAHDGYLVCCYSDHPLVNSLAQITRLPVLGIMQATLLYSYANARLQKLFVLTSTSGWNPLLDEGITAFAGTGVFPLHKFQKTRALDVSVLSLADPAEFKKISDRLDFFLQEYKDDHIDCVLLGCAGMAGLDDKLSAMYPHIEFVDSCKAGVAFLVSLMSFAK
ncbi:hypothetical protein METBIDRAFT_138567 [Metschnikowia bicuspidata var. bicuspidata NRRL YB-4993]|uniref:DCG1-like protein n=1 Tax=Metschnikowia bicuspidata var. bicuspidata NRRL YB-4993 TaxID=869754 RepID=A0A1A0HD83_9ASCO|nr:hypothetical protein METBIDRAFT_138567 [Metschnikowia bicuspidata var. bicuspidata NRRL YB-4993]OBA21857.1 hypothetical protein METBIDRAFT_138567 [Metschnikowia bicuspidata var. bicuspidata NRRL YB-4993]